MKGRGNRPIARNPAGFEDAFAADVVARRNMIGALSTVLERFGFDALETPAIEYADALGKFLPEADQPTGGVFAFREDEQSRWLSLRYDHTAPLARVYAQHVKRDRFPKPYRRYQVGPVWRDEKPGPGRFRQFYQCDFDTVGTGSVAADAEACAVLAAGFDALGIPRDGYVIGVNNRKVLNGVLERARVTGERQNTVALRAMDKLDRLGPIGVRQLLGEGRKDESGDFTPGAGLADEQKDLILSFVTAGGATRAATCANLRDLVGESAVGQEGVRELEQLADLAGAMGLDDDRVRLDPTIVRGLAYYTGPVFEAALTFEITDDAGRVRSFGSVAGGGRYDDLVMRFTGQRVPATGASVGVDRLLAALRALDGAPAASVAEGPVVVTIMQRDRLVDYQAMVTELRAAGIRSELFLGNPKKFGKQLEYADRRRSPAVVIAGDAELGDGTVAVKDLKLGERLAADLQNVSDPDAYQAEIQAKAQRSVPRDQLVAEVRRILDRTAP